MEPGQSEREQQLTQEFDQFADTLPGTLILKIPEKRFTVQRFDEKDQSKTRPEEKESDTRFFRSLADSGDKSLMDKDSIYSKNFIQKKFPSLFTDEDRKQLRSLAQQPVTPLEYVPEPLRTSILSKLTNSEKKGKSDSSQIVRTYFGYQGGERPFVAFSEARVRETSVVFSKRGRTSNRADEEVETLFIVGHGDKFEDEYDITYNVSNPKGTKYPATIGETGLFSINFDTKGQSFSLYFPSSRLLYRKGNVMRQLEEWADENSHFEEDGVHFHITSAPPAKDGRKRAKIDVKDTNQPEDLGNYTILTPLTIDGFDVVNSVRFKSLLEDPTQDPRDENKTQDQWRYTNFAELIGFEVFNTGIQSDPKGSFIQDEAQKINNPDEAE